jgi:hypothetical protein
MDDIFGILSLLFLGASIVSAAYGLLLRQKIFMAYLAVFFPPFGIGYVLYCWLIIVFSFLFGGTPKQLSRAEAEEVRARFVRRDR